MPGSKTSLVTTAFAQITTLSAILIAPIILAPVPIKTLSPIVAASYTPGRTYVHTFLNSAILSYLCIPNDKISVVSNT